MAACACLVLVGCGGSGNNGGPLGGQSGSGGGAAGSSPGAAGSVSGGSSGTTASSGAAGTATGLGGGSGLGSAGASVQAGGGAAGASGSTSRGGTSGVSGGGSSAGAGADGGSGQGGSSANGGTSSGASGASGGGGLPPLSVQGNQLKDPAGKTIVLRGSALIDIGALYSYNGKSASGITGRMDKIAAAGVQGHVVRMPVYPEITYNGGSPACSPLPYPVGTGPSATCTPTASLSGPDYVSKLLKPAVDYAASKNLYVIVDFHQIDSITTGNSAADANTFWSAIAPVFADYSNVLYEPFNEPTDASSAWSKLKPVVQSFIDTIRASAPNNVIIVPSQAWDQHPGDATNDPPTGSNLMYTAHIYPSNWNSNFQNQVTTAAAKVPVFVTEWGYASTDPDPHNWGVSLQSFIDSNGASWTAWVTDNAWTPSMFSSSSLTSLTDFGSLTESWLATKATSDWVQ